MGMYTLALFDACIGPTKKFRFTCLEVQQYQWIVSRVLPVGDKPFPIITGSSMTQANDTIMSSAFVVFMTILG